MEQNIVCVNVCVCVCECVCVCVSVCEPSNIILLQEELNLNIPVQFTFEENYKLLFWLN